MVKLIFLACMIYPGIIRVSWADQIYDYNFHRLYRPTWLSGSWAMKPPMHDAYDRMAIFSRQIFEDNTRRVYEMNDIRYMYEETEEYETGYIMGEIIERYRKLMEEARYVYGNRDRKFRPHVIFAPGLLNEIEKAQQLYFEEYHLVRMVHELKPKYSRAQKRAKKQRSKKGTTPDYEQMLASVTATESTTKRPKTKRSTFKRPTTTTVRTTFKVIGGSFGKPPAHKAPSYSAPSYSAPSYSPSKFSKPNKMGQTEEPEVIVSNLHGDVVKQIEEIKQMLKKKASDDFYPWWIVKEYTKKSWYHKFVPRHYGWDFYT